MSWRQLTGGHTPVIVSLISDEEDNNQVQSDHSQNHPHDRPPLVETVNHEIGQTWTEIWRQHERRSPDVDLPCMLVQVEHVLDAGQTGDLVRSQCKAHESAKGVKGVEAGGQCAGKCAERAQECAPEHDRSATPPG